MKAIDYSLKRWRELTRFVDDGDVPISNNWVEEPHQANCHRTGELAV